MQILFFLEKKEDNKWNIYYSLQKSSVMCHDFINTVLIMLFKKRIFRKKTKKIYNFRSLNHLSSKKICHASSVMICHAIFFEKCEFFLCSSVFFKKWSFLPSENLHKISTKSPCAKYIKNKWCEFSNSFIRVCYDWLYRVVYTIIFEPSP